MMLSTPVAAISEIVADDGEMERLPGLIALGERENVPVITIESLMRFMEEKRCEADPKAVVDVPVLMAVADHRAARLRLLTCRSSAMPRTWRG